MNFTIIDYLKLLNEKYTIENALYILTEIDEDELEKGQYLSTPESITRVCIEIIKAERLDRKGRQSRLVDRRSYIASLLVNEAYNTLTYTGKLLNQYHGTILHHVKRVKNLEKDKQYIENVKDLNDFFNKNKSKI